MLHFKQWLNEAFHINGKEFRSHTLALRDIYNSHPNPENLFIHSTNLNKIGINPKSFFHDTPLGIYLFPLQYVIKLRHGMLPFADDRKYIQVVEIKNPDKVLNMVPSGRNMGMQYLDYLPPEQIQKAQEYIATKKQYRREPTSNYTQLWQTAEAIAILNTKSNKQASIMWAKIFRDAGIDGFNDHGTGTIHTAEPTQAVVFTTNAIKVLHQIDNTGTFYASQRAFDLLKLKPQNLKDYLKFHDNDSNVITRFMIGAKWAEKRNHDSILKNKDDALEFLAKYKPTMTPRDVDTIIMNYEYRPSPERKQEIIDRIIKLRGKNLDT